MPDPCQQEETINDIDQTVHSLKEAVSKQEGWFKTSAWVISIAVMVIGGLSGVILSKLSAIEALLTTSQISIAEVKKDVQSLDGRVRDIEERHRWLDQNGIRTTVRR